MVINLPVVLQQYVPEEETSWAQLSSFSITSTSTLLGCSAKFISITTAPWLMNLSSEVWDPGSCKKVKLSKCFSNGTEEPNDIGCQAGHQYSLWLTRSEINKLAHIINGNRGQRGSGISCVYWNKGPSLLTNKQMDIKTIIADHKPHILGLGEANFRHGQDIEEIKIQGYNLHLDTGLDNSDVGGMARVAVYTHSLLRVKRRPDLEDDKVAAVWLECGLPRQKGMLVCVGYRQWRLLGQADNTSSTVSEQLARWRTFLSKWETALLEDKEVIVMLDANLDFLTWRSTANIPAHHSSIRLKSLIDALFDQIIPMGVCQLVTGATRLERGQPRTGLDHLYSNKPEKLSSVQTHFTGMSDHKLLKVIRYSKSFKHCPRYVRKRSFKNFDEKIFKLKLGESNLSEVLQCKETNMAAEMLVRKLTGILDIVAPIKTIQVKTNYVPGLGEDTKLLQRKRNLAQEQAAKTDNPEDWRIWRSLRNQTTGKVREDKKKWEEKKFDPDENNSSDTWKTVKSLLGWNSAGPPTQLFYQGRMVTKPMGLASSMNKFFIDKVKGLRQKIPFVSTEEGSHARKKLFLQVEACDKYGCKETY